ncbi:MAG: energy-coupling factor transporter transmembrane component T family protein [Candidatus Heimdallarchaeaceae archaeon]
MTLVSDQEIELLMEFKSKSLVDPRAKFIVLISTIICVLYSENLYILIGALLIASFLVAFARVNYKTIIRTILILTFFSILATILIYFTQTKENPYLTFGIIECRFLSTFLLIAWFFFTVDPSEFAVALEKMYFPGKFVWFLTTIYQIIPLASKEAKSINEIRKLKGLNSKIWRVRNTFYIIRKTLNPLITSTINRGVDLAEAMLMKGFVPRRRSVHILEVKIGVFDVAIMVLSITSVVLVILFL